MEKFHQINRIALATSLIMITPAAFAQENCETVKTETYIGQLCDGLRQGKGTEIYPNGRKYIGTFKDDKKEGYGELMATEGYIYFAGNFQNDTATGEGETRNADGKVTYKGSFVEFASEGYGELFFQGGQTYKGNFKAGNQSGQGKMYDDKGRLSYEGEWSKGRRHGQGTFYFNLSPKAGDLNTVKSGKKYNPDYKRTSEVKYIGEFESGLMTGMGTTFYGNGDKYTGLFKRGSFIEDGKHTDKDGNILNSYAVRKKTGYPKKPHWAEKSMRCRVDFDIDAKGKPENLEAHNCTVDRFGEAAIKTVKKWRYFPKIENGVAVPRPNWTSGVELRLLDENNKIIPE